MAFGDPIIGGGGSLIREAIKSPDYSPGALGWTINKNGTAEFNDLTVRGTFQGTNFVVSPDGLFLYDGAPAAGNMLGSWASTAGIDEFGNAYKASLSVYDGAGTMVTFLGGPSDRNLVYNLEPQGGQEFVGFLGGNMVLGWDGNPDTFLLSDVGSIGVIGDGSAIVATSPTNSTLTQSVSLLLHAGTASAASGDATYPHTQLDGDAWIMGANVKAFPVPSFPTQEKWHTVGTSPDPAYAANFAPGSTAGNYQPLEFRIDTEDNLHLEGSFHCTATTSTAQVFSLPAAVANRSPNYRPAVARQIDVTTDSSAGTLLNVAASLQLNSNGPVNLRLSSAAAAGQNFYVNAVIPLNNIP